MFFLQITLRMLSISLKAWITSCSTSIKVSPSGQDLPWLYEHVYVREQAREG